MILDVVRNERDNLFVVLDRYNRVMGEKYTLTKQNVTERKVQ